MAARIRAKAAFIDKQSGKCFDNLTPVGTWVEPGVSVADILPTLTRQFWAVVASEILDDDDGGQPQPDHFKAVAVTFEGCLITKDDILYDVLAASQPTTGDSSEKDKVIVVAIRGANQYLPKHTLEASGIAGQPGGKQSPWGKTNFPALRPQQPMPMMVQAMDLSAGSPYLAAAPTPQGTPGAKPAVMNVLPTSAATSDPSAPGMEHAWGMTGYHNMPLMHGPDGHGVIPGMTSAPTETVLGKRSLDEGDDRDCPLPFLRDISTLLELWDRWDVGMDGQRPLKMLAPSQYRLFRTRYHEIKNFIFRLQERSRNGECEGDVRKVALLMQHELENAKTSHGSRMGLPTFVRQTAALYVQSSRDSRQRIMNNNRDEPLGGGKKEDVAAGTTDA